MSTLAALTKPSPEECRLLKKYWDEKIISVSPGNVLLIDRSKLLELRMEKRVVAGNRTAQIHDLFKQHSSPQGYALIGTNAYGYAWAREMGGDYGHSGWYEPTLKKVVGITEPKTHAIIVVDIMLPDEEPLLNETVNALKEANTKVYCTSIFRFSHPDYKIDGYTALKPMFSTGDITQGLVNLGLLEDGDKISEIFWATEKAYKKNP